MFHIGQLVECVDDSPTNAQRTYTELVLGKIYTVRGYAENHQHPRFKTMRGSVVWLDEIKVRRSGDPLTIDCPFATRRFRPLTEQRLAIFRRLLAPMPKNVVSPAPTVDA